MSRSRLQGGSNLCPEFAILILKIHSCIVILAHIQDFTRIGGIQDFSLRIIYSIVAEVLNMS